MKFIISIERNNKFLYYEKLIKETQLKAQVEHETTLIGEINE
jgi:hypothetical protein